MHIKTALSKHVRTLLQNENHTILDFDTELYEELV